MNATKRKLGVMIGLVAVLLLSVTLVGCGSNIDKNFIGKWKGTEITTSGITMDPESLGVDISLDMKENKTFDLDMMGTGGSGTWKAKDASTVTLTADNDPIDAKLENGKLTLDIYGNVLVFEKA